MTKLAIALVILLLGVLASPSFASDTKLQALLELPGPGGPHHVGTKQVVLNDTNRRRELIVTVWFPADQGELLAPYMDQRTAAELAREWKLQPGFEQYVRTHAWADAKIGDGGPFPIVFLEHGSGTVPALYTVLAEGLASHGYIVVAVNHPQDSLIAVYPDGHEIKSTPYWPLDADRQTQGIAIGKFAEDVLVADVQFVMDRLEEMNSHDAFWKGHLDFSRVAIVGHSMGGTTAALATSTEKRIRAGVNLDGSTYPGMNGDVRPVPVHKPLLFMETEEHASDPATHGKEFVGSRAETYYVVVAGKDHMGFTDARLIQNRFSVEPEEEDHPTNEQAADTLAVTRTIVEEFLAKYLEGKQCPELDSLVRIEKE